MMGEDRNEQIAVDVMGWRLYAGFASNLEEWWMDGDVFVMRKCDFHPDTDQNHKALVVEAMERKSHND